MYETKEKRFNWALCENPLLLFDLSLALQAVQYLMLLNIFLVFQLYRRLLWWGKVFNDYE